MTDDASPGSAALGRRLRVLVPAAARWLAVGAAVGVALSVGLLAVRTPRAATDTAFALGLLVLGFGVTAWSTAIGLGETIEGVQAYMDVSSGWTEASAREAFFVLSWSGFGWVFGAAATSLALGV
ncbi:DUF7268 family protein [Halobacterium litoreum]|uniref:Uncharacterized protein n=1 Tax=Halobacterium litoreum TaxID=2039234 RepID=A0ABD5NFD2_9EURY|nr:hypothetical protein [Halobacterium litoreum]UHH13104.1 hypothetical protein LT972_13200 [Halobacterium litoreum]